MNPVDIVIPAAGRSADLLRLLQSLHTECVATLASTVASITVTDDRYSMALGEQLATQFPQVRYVAGPARGPAANRNHGARHGQADWLLFLDDDCYLASDLLRAYAQQAAAQPQATVLEGAIHAVGPRPNGNHHAPLNTRGGCLWSCNLMLKRELFEQLGGFDERFPFACMEDVDLRQRLLATGAVVVFSPEAGVFHPWRSISERELSRQIISHAIYAQKHAGFVRDWTLLHAARMAWGRLRLYAAGGFVTIPWAKYRTVVYDLAAPLALLAVTRWPALRRSVDARYRQAT